MIINEIRTPVKPHEMFEYFKGFPHSFLLESGLRNPSFGHYSILGADPFLIFRSTGRQVEIIEGETYRKITGNPFNLLNDLLEKYQTPFDTDTLFPVGGAVGYFGYDLKDLVERLPSRAKDDTGIPECYLGFFETFLVVDHVNDKTYLAAAELPGRDSGAALKVMEHHLKALHHQYADRILVDRKPAAVSEIRLKSNFTKPGYLNAVRKVKEYIAAGDIYQANLSQRFSAPMETPPYRLYRRLRKVSPAPFAAFLNYNEFQVISSSPERFLQLRENKVETRPIKGTRPRSTDPVEDERLAQELLASEKDRAELIMIVDLERNDLGRICEYGSVHVSDLLLLEKYATVHHLVSTVRGKLKAGATHVDCLKACFPGGSITGAPKIRAMEIIDELEPTKRNIYTGAIGYLGFNQVSDLNIVIRTMVCKDGEIRFQVGGGIVADSDPEAEYQETLVKAKALIETLTGKKGPE